MASMAALLQQQPDVQGLSAILRTLRTATKVSDEVKARAEGLSKEGASRQAAGATGEARMLLSQAAALLLGRPWGAREEFAASLALRPAAIVADLSEPLVGHLSQTYPAGYPGATHLRLRLSLAEAAPRTAIDLVVPSGKMVRDIGVWHLPVRDLVDEPFYFDASLTDVPEGSYLLTAQVLDGEAVAARVSIPVYLVRGLASQRAGAKWSGSISRRPSAVPPSSRRRLKAAAIRWCARPEITTGTIGSRRPAKWFPTGFTCPVHGTAARSCP